MNGRATSWESASGIQLNNRYPREIDLSKNSIKRWTTLAVEFESSLEYLPLVQIVLYD